MRGDFNKAWRVSRLMRHLSGRNRRYCAAIIISAALICEIEIMPRITRGAISIDQSTAVDLKPHRHYHEELPRSGNDNRNAIPKHRTFINVDFSEPLMLMRWPVPDTLVAPVSDRRRYHPLRYQACQASPASALFSVTRRREREI